MVLWDICSTTDFCELYGVGCGCGKCSCGESDVIDIVQAESDAVNGAAQVALVHSKGSAVNEQSVTVDNGAVIARRVDGFLKLTLDFTTWISLASGFRYIG